ncbi:MAG: hypothetical protein C4K49_06650 [Candidatus Thorarchaeota archaeon]|nr:MAG: hypothetical protein C4K49_06650 [Candidatus Thorarchaeota archaeon]
MNVLVVGYSGAGTKGIAQALGGPDTGTVVRTVELTQAESEDFPSRIEVSGFVPDLVVVATDGSLENVTRSRHIARVLNKQFPGTEKIAIANRPSELGSLSTEKISEILGLTAYARFESD